MDVVYVVREGGNAELRYSLRSLANLEHDQVWIVGYCPTFVTGVRYLRTRQTGSKHSNVWHNWAAAVAHDLISAEFVMMNDDMFVVEPVAEIPTLHHGPLAAHAAGRSSHHGAAMLRTDELLRARGITEPLSYDLHTPMVVRRDGLGDALALCQRDPQLVVKSIYGNLNDVGGDYSDDVKVHANALKTVPGPFVSTADNSFGPGRIGNYLRAMFPSRCRYEASR